MELNRDSRGTGFTPTTLASMMRGFVLVGHRPSAALCDLVDRTAAAKVHQFPSKHATTLVRLFSSPPHVFVRLGEARRALRGRKDITSRWLVGEWLRSYGR